MNNNDGVSSIGGGSGSGSLGNFTKQISSMGKDILSLFGGGSGSKSSTTDKNLSKQLTAAQKQANNQRAVNKSKEDIKDPNKGMLDYLTNANADPTSQEENVQHKMETDRARQVRGKKDEKRLNTPPPPVSMTGALRPESNPTKTNQELPLDPIMIGIMGNFLTGTLNYFDRAIHDAFVFGGDGLTGHGQQLT